MASCASPKRGLMSLTAQDRASSASAIAINRTCGVCAIQPASHYIERHNRRGDPVLTPECDECARGDDPAARVAGASFDLAMRDARHAERIPFGRGRRPDAG